MDKTEICLPLSSLSVADTEGNTVSPSQGDSVDVTITGTVSRIDGDMAYIRPDASNGEALPGTSTVISDDTNEAGMRAMAAAADADEDSY